MFEKDEQENQEVQELARQLLARIENFGTCEGFSDADLFEIMKAAKNLLEPLPSLIEVVAPLVVFGDIHGQLGHLLQFVKAVGRPPDRQLLFLGDYVDRSSKSLEVVCWLFCMKILHPSKIHLLRGNHEVRRVNACYGFRDEMIRKRSSFMWKIVNEVFSELPLCASINRRILCMHGGISPRIDSWNSLTELKKPRLHGECESGMAVDLLWSDPTKEFDDFEVNKSRGISCFFGHLSVDHICSVLDVELIIRAHQVKMRGYEFEFDDRLLTVFSAPYYSGAHSNLGSVATISRTLKLQMVTLKPTKSFEVMKAEREKRRGIVKKFQPWLEKTPNKITCQSSLPVKPKPDPSQTQAETPHENHHIVGKYSTFAHDTKHCKKPTDERYYPFKHLSTGEDIPSTLSMIRQTQPYGVEIALSEEITASEAIRRKMGLLDGKESEPHPAKTPTPDLFSPSDLMPPPPPPPPPDGSSEPSSAEQMI